MNSPADNTEQVKKLHALFERLTGNRCMLSYMRDSAWHEYIRRGFGERELEGVVRWIRREMGRKGSGYSPASLQFSRLIQDTDLFEDRLNLAREAWRRARPAPPPVRAEQHVGDIRREVELPPEESTSQVAEVCPEALAKFREEIQRLKSIQP